MTKELIAHYLQIERKYYIEPSDIESFSIGIIITIADKHQFVVNVTFTEGYSEQFTITEEQERRLALSLFRKTNLEKLIKQF